MAARARLAVAELKCTGGFNLSVLMIATPTGSGWLERQAVDSLECLHSGDTAIVSMQYSYQPSWVSFLFHQDLPRESGQAPYRAVRSEWESMPAQERPKLLVYGLSLGASGMQAAFADVDELTKSVDGGVFSGALNISQPRGTLQEARDSGSPHWQPTFDGGRSPDVSDSMGWIPLVTYVQVAFDMFMGESVPHSHGHNFGDVAVEAWHSVLTG